MPSILFNIRKAFRGTVVPPSIKPTLGNKHTSLATTGYIWITNTGTNKLERTNTNTLAVTSYPTGGVTPSGIAFDGTHLYVTCFGSSTIVKMTTAGAIVASASLGSGLHQVIFDGTDLWASSYWDGRIIKISTALVELASYTMGHYPINLVFDGSKVWVAGFDFTTYATGTGVVTKLNLDATLNASYTIGTNPYGIVFDGTYIWVGAFLTGNIYKVNASTGAILATYNTGVANSTITGFSYFNYAGGILIVTVSKDYSPYNLPDNYNKSHVFSVADGSLQQLETLGIDPRNGSVDGFNFVYTAGYGDGSVTRYPLFATAPVPSTLLHFSSLPPTDSSAVPITPTITTTGSLSLTTGVFGDAAVALTDTVIYFTPSVGNFAEAGDFTFRFRYKTDGRSYTPVISNGSSTDYLYIQGGTYHIGTGDFDNTDTGVAASSATFDAISLERKSGILYLYVNGTLVGSRAYTRFISSEPILIELRLATIDEFGYFLGTALAAPASSYTVETSPY